MAWHYLNVFRVQNPPLALGLSKGSGGLRQAHKALSFFRAKHRRNGTPFGSLDKN
jgi:hypothetical protein